MSNRRTRPVRLALGALALVVVGALGVSASAFGRSDAKSCGTVTIDENAWAATAPHGTRPVAAVIDEMSAVRRSTLALVESLDETTIGNTGVANNTPVSARAICWIMAGHTKHHLDILAERYGVKY
jgi:hypothetical protein